MSVQLKANNQDIYAKKKEYKCTDFYDDGTKQVWFDYAGGSFIKDLELGDIVNINDIDKYIYLGIDYSGYMYLFKNNYIRRFAPYPSDSSIKETNRFAPYGSKDLFTS